MKKLLLISFLSMFVGSQAQANFISVITGADMAGMEVTVTFDDGTSDMAIWEVVSDPTINRGDYATVGEYTTALEGRSGKAQGDFWELTQQGDSMGNLDGQGNLFGLWTLSHYASIGGTASTITNMTINALAGNIVFDTIFDSPVPGPANGSENGRFFLTDPAMAGNYSDNFQDELFGTLSVDMQLGMDEDLIFMADTDAIAVSAPTTISLFMLSLLGLVMNARRKQA